MTTRKILFVCLGNICRSSAAEGVMRRLVEEAGRADEFEIDSAGILSYHRGELPDPRMRAHASRRGYDLVHRSRPVTTDDLSAWMPATWTTCATVPLRLRSGKSCA